MGRLWHFSRFMGRKPKNPNRDPFGAWMLFLRREAKMSQAEMGIALAKAMGKPVETATISNWERNGCLAGRFSIPAIADALGVSIETLLRVHRLPNGKYSPVRLEPALEKEVQNLSKLPLDPKTQLQVADAEEEAAAAAKAIAMVRKRRLPAKAHLPQPEGTSRPEGGPGGE